MPPIETHPQHSSAPHVSVSAASLKHVDFVLEFFAFALKLLIFGGSGFEFVFIIGRHRAGGGL
ncbi:MAG: hypothetical protein LBC18_16360, partial [Opitutaceae bacterium]|nr:hypothetical protein [Opitutaceae bacterium]